MIMHTLHSAETPHMTDMSCDGITCMVVCVEYRDAYVHVSVEHTQYMYIHHQKTIRQLYDRVLCSPIGPI